MKPGAGSINLESPEIHFGIHGQPTQLHMNGEIQEHAYTNTDHSYLNDLQTSVEINDVTHQLTLSIGLISDEAIILKTNNLDIKGVDAQITMNGETQSHCFTDAYHTLLHNINNQLGDHSSVIDVNNSNNYLTLTSGNNGN